MLFDKIETPYFSEMGDTTNVPNYNAYYKGRYYAPKCQTIKSASPMCTCVLYTIRKSSYIERYTPE